MLPIMPGRAAQSLSEIKLGGEWRHSLCPDKELLPARCICTGAIAAELEHNVPHDEQQHICGTRVMADVTVAPGRSA